VSEKRPAGAGQGPACPGLVRPLYRILRFPALFRAANGRIPV